MKKLVSLTLALLLALCALLPAMAEETRTLRIGVLSMLNVSEAEMVNYKKVRALIGQQLEKEGVLENAIQQFLDGDAPGFKPGTEYSFGVKLGTPEEK